MCSVGAKTAAKWKREVKLDEEKKKVSGGM